MLLIVKYYQSVETWHWRLLGDRPPPLQQVCKRGARHRTGTPYQAVRRGSRWVPHNRRVSQPRYRLCLPLRSGGWRRTKYRRSNTCLWSCRRHKRYSRAWLVAEMIVPRQPLRTEGVAIFAGNGSVAMLMRGAVYQENTHS